MIQPSLENLQGVARSYVLKSAKIASVSSFSAPFLVYSNENMTGRAASPMGFRGKDADGNSFDLACCGNRSVFA